MKNAGVKKNGVCGEKLKDEDAKQVSIYISSENKYEMTITNEKDSWAFKGESKSESITHSNGKKPQRKIKWRVWFPSGKKQRRRTVLGISMLLFSFLLLLLTAISMAGNISMLPDAVDIHNSWIGEKVGVQLYSFFSWFEKDKPMDVSQEDLELFEKAKAVSQKATYPRSVKIAFMFLTRGPLPMAPLWARFFNGHEDKLSLYVHADPSYAYDPKELPDIFHGKMIRSEPVVWSGISMVAAERRLLATALLDPSNRYFVLLSEACIPIRAFPTVYSVITSSRHSFVTVVKQLDTWKPDMLPLVPLRKWRKGDEWKELHRSLALLVVSDTEYYKKFTNHVNCRKCDWHKTGASDEHYIPTLLYNKRPEMLANRTLHWVDWKNHFNWEHPHTYTESEVTPGLLRELQGMTIFRPFGDDRSAWHCTHQGGVNPCFVFARKFDQSSLNQLLNLSMPVMGY